MLRLIREKTTGWVAMAILGVLIVPFALFGLDQYLVQSGGSTVATIKAPPAWWSSAPSFWPVSTLWRQEEVGTEEFRNRFEQVRQQTRAEQGDAFDARAFEDVANKRAVLEMLIDQKVQAIAAQTAGVAVSDSMVIDEIQRIPAFQVDGRFDPQRYQLALASQVPAQSPAQFDRAVRDSLQQGLVMNTLAESNFVTPGEMDRLIRLMGEQRDISMLVMPAANTTSAAINDADVQTWYDAHLADYRTPEQVSIEYISLDAADMPAPPPADEEALRYRYDQQADKFAQQEERLASHILVEVAPDADAATVAAAKEEATKLAVQARAEGADFAEIAASSSDDPASPGGDLGWINRGTMPGPLEDALFAMKPEQISDPVKTEFGWHVIKLREIKAGEREPFEQVRESLAREQAESDRERMFSDLSSRVVDAVLQDPSSLASAAAAANQTVHKLGPFDARSNEGVAANGAVKRAAFSEILIQDGTVSDPIEMGPEHNIWIRVVSHTPEEAQPLDQVREQVVAAIKADGAQKAARERAAALLARLQKGETLAELANGEALEAPETLTEVQRGAPLVAPGVSDAVFEVQVKEGAKASGSKVLADGRIVLFTIDKVVQGDVAGFPAEQRLMLQQQLGQAAGIDDVQALLAKLRKVMKIRVLEQNL